MTVAERFAEFAGDLTLARLPARVVEAVRRRTLDAIGCMVASAADGAATAVVDAVRSWAGARETGVVGFDFRVPAPQAAMVNATLAGALMHDAVYVPALAPIDAAVIPAALATAEEAARDGAVYVAATAAGLEVAARLAQVDPAAALPAGAAIAAARVWGLSERETAAAIALACGAPTPAAEHRGSVRRGWAALSGVMAADLARRGVKADDDVPGRPLDDPGDHWAALDVALKPYPAALWVQASMDAAATLGVKAGDVDEILCSIPSGAAAIVCEPRTEKVRPVTDDQARVSLPFAVAAALVGGRAPTEMFGEDARTDRRVLALAERVGYEDDASLAPAAGRVRVMLRDGRVRTSGEIVAPGAPGNALSDEDLIAKFTANARRRLDQASAAKLASMIMRIDSLDSIDELIALSQGET